VLDPLKTVQTIYEWTSARKPGAVIVKPTAGDGKTVTTNPFHGQLDNI
jgi:hypothetical protein